MKSKAKESSNSQPSLDYVNRYKPNPIKPIDYTCLYHPVTPLTTNEELTNLNEDVKRFAQRIRSMEQRYLKFKKIIKIVSERVGLDSANFL